VVNGGLMATPFGIALVFATNAAKCLFLVASATTTSMRCEDWHCRRAQWASRIMFQVAGGTDPQAIKRAARSAGTFDDIADRYL
jgi:hypothetical protein